ncbi:hypothetical protein EUGRSUZ_B01881 [Eucalyptus grandis]|uniref:Uncharacterized protein n=1 Tax=Eucalyptus grandis TaxID=71139 RepID=A0ACC3LNK2_EUCGR|nr:hypothetical protein EUGRSUZ_B01881 [Eucalyptus grandis]
MAQRLYNDPKMSSYFERKAWVCVSDVFDVLHITKTILQSITGLSCEGKDLNWLQVKLKDDLSERKFLVVLDDVWNEKYGEWTSLLKPFEAGAKGSKIIITTRNHSVVSITGASPYSLKELSVDNCTDLLAYHALEARNFERHPHLQIVGKKIAEKCRASAKNDEVLPALKLSYVHLPSYLKRCFTYCAVFPKDYEFERDELVLLWITEGFLDGRKAKENILRSGRKYFDELVSRSFFQQSNIDTSKFLMHDLLNDLAKSIADKTCFTSRESLVEESQVVSDEDDATFKEKARCASFVSQCVTSKSLRAYATMKVLRSLMLLTIQFNDKKGIFISGKVLHDLLTNLKYLRVLSLCHCNIVEVPNCVCDLKHLRYLNLSYTNIKRLPESIGALCKLQALILRGCQMLSMLPTSITKLVRLQFLDIRDTGSLKKMPLGMSNLKNIIIFPKFVVGPEKGSLLKELKNLQHLQGELFIAELQKHLVVRSCHSLVGTLPGQLDLLRKLEIHSCPHLNNSTKVICLPSLCELYLKDCNKEILKIFANLTSLISLKIENLVELVCFDHGFTSYLVKLKELYIRQCDKLNYLWQNGNEMQNLACLQSVAIDSCPQFTSFVARDGEMELSCNLEKMELRNCTSLEKLPSKLYTLRHLRIENCPKISRIITSQDDHSNNNSISQPEFLNMSECDSLISFPFAIAESLGSLTIDRCENLISLPRCLLTLSHLTKLDIQECPALEIENFPSLPITLMHLTLVHVPKMKSLPKEWHHLMSLWNMERLSNGLRNHLSSLESLEIVNCPKLRDLPEDDLPPSLQELYIERCEILRDRCSKDTGDYWPLIQEIPYIEIDDVRIQ